eukprot:GHRR01033701.1.p1 GENE.GHRR01033701.1~~GHRR01033701.1.p1  ORF type:complete len:116 (+),score=17.03 GHRR01033701.1:282-629(+)
MHPLLSPLRNHYCNATVYFYAQQLHMLYNVTTLAGHKAILLKHHTCSGCKPRVAITILLLRQRLQKVTTYTSTRCLGYWVHAPAALTTTAQPSFFRSKREIDNHLTVNYIPSKRY